MKKRIVLCFLALVLLLSGCGGTETAEKPVIRLATCSGVGLLNETKIYEINQGDYPYTVEIVDYLEDTDGDVTQAVINLNKELAAGDGPDIIDLGSFPIDMTLYASKGVFVDLYPFLDQDEALSREDFVESVRRCCEYDGQLVGMMSGFSVKTMYVREDVCPGQDSWSVSDFYPCLGCFGVAYLGSDEYLDGESLLYQLCATSFQSFVDYETKTVSFDSETFIDLLKRIRDAEGTEGEMVGRLDSVWDFMSYQLCEQAMGGGIKYIGFPTLDGESSGSYINNKEDYLAICADSDKKDLCWAFLREFLMAEFQEETYIQPVTRSFPTNVHAMQKLIDYSMERIYDEDGTEITQRTTEGYPCEPATQAQVDAVMALIDSAAGGQRNDNALDNILIEEISAFLSGDQDAETTAKVLQNRVEIYVNEIS